MKSEHRHDLQANDLAKLTQKLGEFLQKNAMPLLIGASAVVVAVIAGMIMANQSRTTKELGWRRFAASANAEDFAKVADDYAGSAVGAWARLKEAEANLQQGIQVAFADRPSEITEISELKQAKAAFDRLLDGASVPDAVRERALIGMARYLETTCDGDTEKAIGAYRTIIAIAEFPDAPQAKFAEQRIDALERAETKDFYAWFFKQRPKPEKTDKDANAREPDIGQSSTDSDSSGQPVVSETTGVAAQASEEDNASTGDSSTPVDPTAASSADGSGAPKDSKDDSTPDVSDETSTEAQPSGQKKPSVENPATPTPEPSKAGDAKSDSATETKEDAGSN